jgi:hypothetical protein
MGDSFLAVHQPWERQMKKTFFAAAVIAATSFAALPAQAYIFGFSSFDSGNVLTLNGSTVVANSTSGWFDSNGGHSATNTNYIAAAYNGLFYNDFFAFDVSGVTGPVTTASFTVNSYTVDPSYDAVYPIPYSLHDVSTSVAILTSDNSGNVAAFNDLASGSYYGGRYYTVANSYTYETITLTAAAIADINAAILGSGSFVLGGSTNPLSVPAPEPMSLTLLGVGLGGLAASRLRNRSTAI